VPALGLRTWKERMLDAVADRCIRQSRRDLRDSGVAEQGLFDQLDEACAASAEGQLIELAIQAKNWFQNIVLMPNELPAFCRPLVRRVLQTMESVLSAAQAVCPPAAVVLSEAAAQLPGLTNAVREHTGAATTVLVLPADAAARAAHELAERWRSGALPSGHMDVSLPLARSSPEGGGAGVPAPKVHAAAGQHEAAGRRSEADAAG